MTGAWLSVSVGGLTAAVCIGMICTCVCMYERVVVCVYLHAYLCM